MIIEERVGEFVIGKYIEINKGIIVSVMYRFMLIHTLLVLQYNGIIGSTFMYLQQKDIAKKVQIFHKALNNLYLSNIFYLIINTGYT